jgi:hypothetical protein
VAGHPQGLTCLPGEANSSRTGQRELPPPKSFWDGRTGQMAFEFLTTDGHGWTRILQARRAGIFVDAHRKNSKASFRSGIIGICRPDGADIFLGCASTKMARRRCWGGVVSALCADAFEPEARRYNRIPNSAFATDSFPEFILGWTIGVIGV